mmetsp:Transcript_25824/g.45549  ORF Transcript_25824/g.45549 Transcript_25824/m.45549 type:complete len:195 (+) Transcript_25824:5408-5992(+)
MDSLRYALLLTLALTQDCKPPTDCSAFCRSTYTGQRNYYNATDGHCYPAQKCILPQTLDVESNTCKSVSVPQTATNSSSNSSEIEIEDPPIVCVHGEIVSANLCKCEEGYTTISSNSTAAGVEMCNINIDDVPEDDTFEVHEDGSLTLKSQEDADEEQGGLPFWSKVVILVGEALILIVAVKVATVYIRKHYQS